MSYSGAPGVNPPWKSVAIASQSPEDGSLVMCSELADTVFI